MRRPGWTPASASERVLEGVRHQLRELSVVNQELLLGLADEGSAGCTVTLEGWLAGGGLAASVATSEELLAGVRPHRLTGPELRVGLADKGLASCRVALEGLLAGGFPAACGATLEEVLAGVRPHTLPEELWEPLLLLRDECDIAGELAEDPRGLLLLLGEWVLADKLLEVLEEGLLDEYPRLPEDFGELLLKWVFAGELLEDFEKLQLEDASQLTLQR